MKLLLWDIDGTLLYTGFSGCEYMQHVGRALFGERFDLAGIEFGGQVDRALFKLALDRAGVVFDDEHWSRFRTAFADAVRERLAAEADRMTVLPGARELVQRFAEHPAVRQGIVTGNFRQTAKIKLAAARYDTSAFGPSAYGCEADLRHELIDLAIDRYHAAHGNGLQRRDVIVIGDTPRDIAAARDAGCTSFAVATGRYAFDALRAAGADHVVANLSDARPLLELLDG